MVPQVRTDKLSFIAFYITFTLGRDNSPNLTGGHFFEWRQAFVRVLSTEGSGGNIKHLSFPPKVFLKKKLKAISNTDLI